MDAIDCHEKIVIWIYKVIEVCDLSRENVSVTMSYLDRFLSTKEAENYLYDRRNLQLAGMCCLMLAIKVNESIDVDMSYIDELSKGSYSITELRETEHLILLVLQWRMCPPTASIFTDHILQLFRHDFPPSILHIIKHFSQIQIEISIKKSSFSSIKPSIIAMSSVLNAVDSLQSYVPFELLQDVQEGFLNNHFEIDVTIKEVSEVRERLMKQANFIDG